MTITPDYVDSNWCPDCGLPRGVCDCEENRAAYELLYPDEIRNELDYMGMEWWLYGEVDDDDTAAE